MKPKVRVNARWMLAVVGMVVSLVLIVGGGRAWLVGGAQTSFESRPYNELTKAAVDLRLDEAKRLFELALLVAVALWGLVIAKAGEARVTLGDRPEVILLGCASVLLALSFASHVSYVGCVTEAFKVAGATCFGNQEECLPDLFVAAFNDFFEYQKYFLLSGTLLAVLTLMSAYRLK